MTNAKSKGDEAEARFSTERDEDGKHSPVLHVLMSDGRVTEFSRKAVVLPDTRNGPDDAVYALLVNGKGEPYQDAKTGKPVILDVPAMTLERGRGPMTYKEVAEAAGVSLSSVKRAVYAGDLPLPVKVGHRSVRFAPSDVAAWAEKVKRPVR